MKVRTLFLLMGLLAIAAGCQVSSEPEGTGGNSAFTADASAGPAGPSFTATDTPTAYGARVRVAFGDGPFQEIASTPAHEGSALPAPRYTPFAFGLGRDSAGQPVYAYFGATNAKTLEVGTYSCADGDGRILAAEWNTDGTAKPPLDAQTCSIVIDQIEPGPSANYARVYGRFEAAAAPPDGLPQSVTGAFLADFPVER